MVNGVRLVYPMEGRAMRLLNLLGNHFFSWAFSWILGQRVKDTLCGTKVLWRADYERIAANRSYFGDFDPFGDFDLLFGAAKQNLKIVELPVPLVYTDEKRSFGGVLDDAATRLEYYHLVLDRSIAAVEAKGRRVRPSPALCGEGAK